MKAACEVCGAPDLVLIAQLRRQPSQGTASLELPDVFPFGSPRLCAEDRAILVEVVQVLRSLRAAGDVHSQLLAVVAALRSLRVEGEDGQPVDALTRVSELVAASSAAA